MKKVIMLKTAAGQTVKVMLDNWGGGMDRFHRRWTLQPEGWHCVDTGEVAQSRQTLTSHPMKLWDARAAEPKCDRGQGRRDQADPSAAGLALTICARGDRARLINEFPGPNNFHACALVRAIAMRETVAARPACP